MIPYPDSHKLLNLTCVWLSFCCTRHDYGGHTSHLPLPSLSFQRRLRSGSFVLNFVFFFSISCMQKDKVSLVRNCYRGHIYTLILMVRFDSRRIDWIDWIDSKYRVSWFLIVSLYLYMYHYIFTYVARKCKALSQCKSSSADLLQGGIVHTQDTTRG